jgi:hypothetical protein
MGLVAGWVVVGCVNKGARDRGQTRLAVPRVGTARTGMQLRQPVSQALLVD